jgi:hypothetical protein
MKSSSRFALVTFTVIFLSFVITGSIKTAFAGGLPAPALITPANAATVYTGNQPVTLDWASVSDATKYKVQVYKNKISSANRIVNATATTDQFAPATTFQTGITYIWRVKAKNSSTSSPWATANFTMTDQAPSVPPLPAPGIQGPADGAQIALDAQPFVFNWDVVAGATGYHLQISSTSDFSSMIYDNTPSSDGWAAQTPFTAGTYYWRVSAANATQTGLWTATRSVVISGSVATPPPVSGNPWESPLATQVPYTANSPWNTPIGANPTYDRNSALMVDYMKNGVTGGKIYSDTTQYNYPVYWADANTPKYNVPCMTYRCTVVTNGVVTKVDTMVNVPIPDGAKQANGTDAQMIIIDTTTGIEYGFYHAARQADGSWTAANGYKYPVTTGEGTQPGFGSRGAGVPYYAGLIRPWEIRAGEIKHALAFVYQFTAAAGCVYPAAQTDGKTTGTYTIPEGARLQLNPALTDADFTRWGLSPAGKTVARALQQYGMYLIDSGGSPKIIAENLVANTLYGLSWSDPDLGYDKNVIANVPYSEFRVLSLPDGYYNGAAANYGKCVK